ncbi:MAG: DUF3135 domain-containing protein [Candidatus Kaiserbacteria bacterium]|nr:DUF3135 domain-containing protein [Candidatus Kaiserbacteria bacterium]MCB9816462.1 DUF3135 domain-containing protein [Candidatus Nomurabacteria bacterium]
MQHELFWESVQRGNVGMLALHDQSALAEFCRECVGGAMESLPVLVLYQALSFTEVARLAAEYPDTFSHFRRALIEETIANAADPARAKQLQWRIDQERARHRSALGACIAISRMMHAKAPELKVQSDRLVAAFCGQHCDEPSKATVLPFKK